MTLHPSHHLPQRWGGFGFAFRWLLETKFWPFDKHMCICTHTPSRTDIHDACACSHGQTPLCTPTLKSVTDVPDAKGLVEEGLCRPEHRQQPKSFCPRTWAPSLLSPSLLHTLRDYTVIFSIFLSIDLFFCQPIFFQLELFHFINVPRREEQLPALSAYENFLRCWICKTTD